MIVEYLLIGVLFAALVGTSAYWRRRLATVREAMTVTEDWEAAGHAADTSGGAVDGSLRLALEEAASTAGVPIEKLPERIEAYEERVREQATEIERLHEAWVTSWWEAATNEPVPEEGPRIVTLEVDAGGRDVVRTFAIHAMEAEEEVVIAVDRSSGAFAVGVSEPLTDIRGADGIVDEIVSYAGGGGGGADQLATGGGTTPEAAAGAVDVLKPQLETELREALGSRVNTAD